MLNNSTTLTQTSQPQFLSLPISEIILDETIDTRSVDNHIVIEYKEAMEGYGAKWQDHLERAPPHSAEQTPLVRFPHRQRGTPRFW